MTSSRAKIGSLTLLLVVVGAAFATPIVAAASTPSQDLDYSDERTPNPFIEEDTLTVATHDMTNMSSPLQYYNDSGDIATLPAVINSSIDETVGVRYDKINTDIYSTFPRKSGEDSPAEVSAVDDKADWSSDATGTSGTLSLTDSAGNTAAGVESLRFSTSSQGSGDTAKWTYSNFSLGSAEKRVPLVGANINSIESGAEIQVRFVDSDGDYVDANATSSSDTSLNAVMASGATDGIIWQQKVNTMAVEGSGDGTMSSIEKVRVVITGGDGDLTLYGLDAARKSAVDIGETMKDTDSDGDVEATKLQDLASGGVLKLTGLSTLPTDSADVHDLKVYSVLYRMQDVEGDANWNARFAKAGNYSYAQKLEYHVRLKVPSAIDLTHSGLTLKARQGFVNERYAVIEYAEGISDTDFGNVSSWSSVSSTYDSLGTTHTLDSTVQAGTSYGVHGVILLQNSEKGALMVASMAGGGGSGGFWAGNPLGSIVNWFIAGLAGVTALVAGSKAMGGGTKGA